MSSRLWRSVRFVAFVSAVAIPGCSPDGSDAGVVPLGFGGPIEAEVVRHWSSERMAEVPRWTAAESPEFVLVEDSLSRQSVTDAVVLSDGSVVLAYGADASDSILLHLLDPASGEETGIAPPKDADGESLHWGHSFLGTHDGNIILMVDNLSWEERRTRRWTGGRLGTHVWYADRDGDFRRPSSYIEAMGGELLGVFPDGSLVVALSGEWADTTAVYSATLFRPMEDAAAREVLPFAVAAPMDPTGMVPAWAHLPSRASAVAGDTVWTVPTENPELLAVHRSGGVLLKVEWEAGDRSFPPTASETWDHAIWDGAERFPAAIYLMIGTDGLIYVRRWSGPEWLVFSPAGDLMARLELSWGWRVLAFGDRSVVTESRNQATGLREVRVHVLVGSAAQDRDPEASACPRKAARVFPVGSVTSIGDGGPACRIRIRETPIRLEAHPEGSRPDPGRTVLLDSNGRFITGNAVGWDATISVWDSRGRYLSSFGREGEGPGELRQRGMLTMFIDGRDHLHVRDGAFAWSVFSPEHVFLRRVSAHVMGGLPGTTAMLDDGSALASDRRGDPGRYFRVVDSTGALQRAFGTVKRGSPWIGREITHAGGDTFWAAPPEDGSEAYVLEEWGVDGTLRRTLRREVSWWQWRGHREISSAVRRLHLARNGLLYVALRRPTYAYVRQFTRGGNRVGDPRELRERRDAGFEIVLEVIDTRSGELLASDVHPASRAREIVPSLFRGSLRGYRYKVGDDGFPFVEIVDVQLVARRRGEASESPSAR